MSDTRFDAMIKWFKDHPLFAGILMVGCVVVVLGQVAESLRSIGTLLYTSKIEQPLEPKSYVSGDLANDELGTAENRVLPSEERSSTLEPASPPSILDLHAQEGADSRTGERSLHTLSAPVEDSPSLSSWGTVLAWNKALYEGNLALAEDLTSKRSHKYIGERFGSLSELSKIYRAGPAARNILVSQEDGEGIARVTYRVFYADGSIKVWIDTLFWEEGRWRLAPEFVSASVER